MNTLAQPRLNAIDCGREGSLFSNMVLVGLTGGLATGKSTVAKLFQEGGAIIIDADDLARRVVQPGRPAWRDIVRTYGGTVLDADRTLNRRALARIVFSSPRQLRRLNNIVHPRVAREQARLTREAVARNPRAVVIYDAPLLIEASAHKRMDKLIVITTDRDTQIARLKHRNHFSRTEAIRRIRSQMPLSRKKQMAHYTIDGTLPVRRLRGTVKNIHAELRKLAEDHYRAY